MTLYIGYKATYLTYYNYKMLPENVEHFCHQFYLCTMLHGCLNAFLEPI